jgi:hypothetical protein
VTIADAMTLFEHAIEQVYMKRHKKMLKLASGSNKRCGSAADLATWPWQSPRCSIGDDRFLGNAELAGI